MLIMSRKIPSSGPCLQTAKSKFDIIVIFHNKCKAPTCLFQGRASDYLDPSYWIKRGVRPLQIPPPQTYIEYGRVVHER